MDVYFLRLLKFIEMKIKLHVYLYYNIYIIIHNLIQAHTFEKKNLKVHNLNSKF